MSDPFDLIVVGLGSAGIAAAEFAAGLEMRVAAVEQGRPGGHRLWSGDVPISTLAATGRTAHAIRSASQFGMRSSHVDIDPAVVWRRIRAVQAASAADTTALARWRELGIELVTGSAQWVSPTTVAVDGRELEARYILWCTGSEVDIPAVPGLHAAPFDTLETWFRRDQPAADTVVLGSGAEAVAVAQSLARLGLGASLVTDDASILPDEEPALVAHLLEHLRADGVRVVAGATITQVHVDTDGPPAGRIRLDLADSRELTTESLLVAGTRTPATAGLDPVLGDEVPTVDGRGRTPARTTYAAGSVTGRHHLAHAAAHEAIRAVRDMFLPGRATGDGLIPRCTFSDPELAAVGLTSAEAEAMHGEATDVWTLDLDHLDRARADASTGTALVVITVHERIVGAHLLAPRAGEAIHELALAIRHGMKLSDIAALPHVESTVAAGIGRLAVESGIERVQRYRWLLRRP